MLSEFAIGFLIATAAQDPAGQEYRDIVIESITDRNPVVRIANEDEITDRLIVRRIDVVDSDGVIRATLAGELPNPVVDGIEYRRDRVVSGFMIRDEAGNERGGFGYAEALGGPIIALDHGGGEAAGMAVRGNGEALLFMGQRGENITDPRLPGHLLPSNGPSNLFYVMNPDGSQSLSMTDREGNARLRLTVTEDGFGAIEFLDADGNVVSTLAPEAALTAD